MMSDAAVLSSSFESLEAHCAISAQRLKEASTIIDVVSHALDRGSEVHYLGSSSRLHDLEQVLEMGCRGLAMKDWTVPPMEATLRAARRTAPELFADEASHLPLLGLMCLPPALADRLVSRPGGRSMLLVLDGVDATRSDVRLALASISAFCRLHSVQLAIFP